MNRYRVGVHRNMDGVYSHWCVVSAVSGDVALQVAWLRMRRFDRSLRIADMGVMGVVR